MNDVLEAVNTEEDIIYEIVDDIIETENKISSLTNEMIINDDSGPGVAKFDLKHAILKNISVINKLTNDIEKIKSSNNKERISMQTQLSSIEKKICENEKKIKELTSSSTNKSKEDLYRLSYEKIEEIISKQKCEDQLKSISFDIDALNASKNEAFSAYEIFVCNKDSINERIRMLKEERRISKFNIENMISKKESLEEIMHNLKSDNFSNIIMEEISIFFYEIKQCDITKISANICGFINEENYYDNFEICDIKADINCICQAELLSFIQDYSNVLVTQYKINSFISSLANKIFAFANKFNSQVSLPFIAYYIKLAIKIVYYENAILCELTFVEKESKFAKKELIKERNICDEKIAKLTARIEENNKSMINAKKRQDSLLETKAKNLIHLTPEEKEYICLCEKADILLKEKSEILSSLDALEKKQKNEIAHLSAQIEKLTHENKQKELQIDAINSEIKNQKSEVNTTIINLRREIAEKFKLIKTQLLLFKTKHGEHNMDLYNKLVSRINRTLKMTSKTMLNLNYSALTNRNASNNFLNKTSQNDQNRLMLSQSASMSNLSRSVYRPLTMSLNQKPLEITKSRNVNSLIKETANNKNNNSKGKIIHSNEHKNILKEEQNKLSLSIKQLKTNHRPHYSQGQFIKIENSSEIKTKISPLIISTSCYTRMISSSENKFNPLIHSKMLSVFGFEKATIKLDDTITNLVIKTQSQTKTISITDIESTVVNNNIKYIIRIHQRYKHYKNKFNLVDFVKMKEFDDVPLSVNDKLKAAVNEMFNFSLKIYGDKNKKRIEFVLCEYDDIKKWLNGLGYLINNKGNIDNIRNCFI